jgi:two-component system sensor histidine kinase MtrB
VRGFRLHAFEERTQEQAEITFTLLPADLAPARLGSLLERFGQREGADYVITNRAEVVTSGGLPGTDAVPAGLPARVRDDGRAAANTSLEGESYRVVGARVLAVGWVLVVGASAVVGRAVARRTLRPVREAATAASALAEGLLDTRLQVRTGDEFGAWAFSFNTMATALDEKIAALVAARDREARFAADVSHELRTPVASLVAAAGLLEQQDLPEPARRPAELVAEGARRLRLLVEDLLELFRLEAGHEPTELDAHPLARVTAASVDRAGWSDEVDLEVLSDPFVLVDPPRFDRVLVNLVANGLRHGGGEVTVTVGRDGAPAVEVRDQGPGIAAEDLAHLFEPFFRSDSSRSGPGSGLGLSIAAENARSIGGRIEVTSTPGQGATFALHLEPAHDQAPAETFTRVSRPSTPAARSPGLSDEGRGESTSRRET